MADTLDLTSLVTDEVRAAQSERPGAGDWRCAVCNGPVKVTPRTWWVSCDIGMNAMRLDDQHDEGMGCFPVGSDCARKVPAPFRFQYDD